MSLNLLIPKIRQNEFRRQKTKLWKFWQLKNRKNCIWTIYRHIKPANTHTSLWVSRCLRGGQESKTGGRITI